MSQNLLPFAPEAEQGVLGRILNYPNELPDVIMRLKQGEAFYDLRHRQLYTMILEMAEASKPIELLSIARELNQSGAMAKIGGMEALHALMDVAPANLEYYLDIVLEKWAQRQVLAACAEISIAAQDRTISSAEMLEKVGRAVSDTSLQLAGGTDKTAAKYVDEAVDFFEDCWKRKSGTIGLATGFPQLDKLTSGLRRGEMFVLAARPSNGKTSLAMNIAEHVAVNCGTPVAVFSLEMTGRALMTRMISTRSGVDYYRILDGTPLPEPEFKKMTNAAKELKKAPLRIDEQAGLKIVELRARARRMFQRHNVQLIIVDYLQLMQSVTGKNDSRQQEVADISNGLKSLAKELNIPVLAVAQLNRDCEREKNRQPKMSDLRDSGQIEADADCIGLLFVAEEDESKTELRVNLKIVKQRNGPLGTVKFMFHKSITKFEELQKVESSN